MKKVLVLENVSMEYVEDNSEKITALNKASFDAKSGELIAIIGPSGSGKSTLLSVAGALLHPTSGTIYIDGEKITDYSNQQLSETRLQKIGFILQSSNLLPYLTALDQLLVVKRMAGKVTKLDETFANSLLAELGLGAYKTRYPHELSGGQRQRVAVGRALINEPKLILADEPTASLDSNKAHEVVALLQQETERRKAATIMVTHDERMLAYCDRVLQINDGNLLEIPHQRKSSSPL